VTDQPDSVPEQPTTEPDRPVALVTGAARGIGAAVAARLAGDGWRVTLVDVCADDARLGYALATPADLDAAVAATAGCGMGVVADVRDQGALNRAVSDTMSRWGRLDAVVAAAGVIAGGPPGWETSDDVWAAVTEVDLTGVWRLARATIPALLHAPAPRAGRFVAVSSAAGLTGLPGLAAYSAAKHGVVGLVRALAVELAGTGVTVNAVCPGSTDTAMLAATATLYGLDGVDELVAHQPLGRVVEPAEVAGAVAWLCSGDAAAVTGAVIAVDGGMTAT
jgi:SDR family mycofactocin-dependent oxidoreductase